MILLKNLGKAGVHTLSMAAEKGLREKCLPLVM